MHYSLDNITPAFYSKSLKNLTPAFAHVRFAIFLCLPFWRMRAENNQYQPKLCVKAFSESATSQICVAFLRKLTQ